MRKIITCCALCALAASAQPAVATPAQAAPEGKGSGWMKVASVETAEAQLGPGSRGSLMNMAAHNAAPIQRTAAEVSQHKQDPAPGQEHRHRSRPAMLFAALAVMSAIALRRLGATDL